MKQRSRSTQRATTPRPVNHACRDVGHDWQLTTDESFRQCTRRDCRAVERFVYGSWMPIASSVPQPEKQQASASSYQQLAFWSSSQHAERPLHLEDLVPLLTKEQRAHFARLEREYYNLSSGPRARKVW